VTEREVQILGWAWAAACIQLDQDKDPRQYDMAKLLDDAQREFYVQ